MKRLLVRPWSEEDIRKLEALMAKKASAMRCAAALNRSASSVKKMARSLGGDLTSVRALKSESRSRITEAEKSLRTGARRNDGTFV